MAGIINEAEDIGEEGVNLVEKGVCDIGVAALNIVDAGEKAVELPAKTVKEIVSDEDVEAGKWFPRRFGLSVTKNRELYWTGVYNANETDWHLFLILTGSLLFVAACITFVIYPATQMGHEFPQAIYTTNYLQQYSGHAVLPYMCVGNNPAGPCPPHYQKFHIMWWVFLYALVMLFTVGLVIIVYGFFMGIMGPKPIPANMVSDVWHPRRFLRYIMNTYYHVVMDDHVFAFSHTQSVMANIAIHWFIAAMLGMQDIYLIILITIGAGIAAYSGWAMQWENARTDKDYYMRSTHIKSIHYNHLIIEVLAWTAVFVIEVIWWAWYPFHAREGLQYAALILVWILRWLQILATTIYYTHLDKDIRGSWPFKRLDDYYIDSRVAYLQSRKRIYKRYVPVIYDRYNFAPQINPLMYESTMIWLNLLQFILFLSLFLTLSQQYDYIPNFPSSFAFN